MSLGNREDGGARKQSQENCLSYVTVRTHERWEGDISWMSLYAWVKGFFNGWHFGYEENNFIGKQVPLRAQ
jgi:hypothetical protein